MTTEQPGKSKVCFILIIVITVVRLPLGKVPGGCSSGRNSEMQGDSSTQRELKAEGNCLAIFEKDSEAALGADRKTQYGDYLEGECSKKRQKAVRRSNISRSGR